MSRINSEKNFDLNISRKTYHHSKENKTQQHKTTHSHTSKAKNNPLEKTTPKHAAKPIFNKHLLKDVFASTKGKRVQQDEHGQLNTNQKIALFFAGILAACGSLATGIPSITANGPVNLPPEIPYTENADDEQGFKHSESPFKCQFDDGTSDEENAFSKENLFRNHVSSSSDFECNLSEIQEDSVNRFVINWNKNKERYNTIELATGVPSELIAAIHWREAEGDFNRCLSDGTRLGEPIGSFVGKGKIFYTFEDSAIFALNNCNIDTTSITKGDFDSYYDFAEKYNGTGYRVYHDINSPYVWAGTEKYICGKYVSDGSFDPDYIDDQPGVAVLLKNIC